jgi:hypothetical protein
MASARQRPSQAPGVRPAHEGCHAPPVRRGDGVGRGPSRAVAPGPCCFPRRGARARVDLYLDRQGVDTTTPGGKALFRSARPGSGVRNHKLTFGTRVRDNLVRCTPAKQWLAAKMMPNR